MAIVSHHLDFAGSTGRFSLTSGAEYVARYRVHTDDPNEQSKTVGEWFQLNVVPLGSLYQYAGDTPSLTSFADDISVEQRGASNLIWDVIVTYKPSDNQDKDENGDPTQDPLAVRPSINFQTAQYSEPVWESELVGVFKSSPPHTTKLNQGGIGGCKPVALGDRTPVINTAYSIFDPPLAKDNHRGVVRVQRNLEPPYDMDTLDEYMHAVNSDRFKIDKPWSITKIFEVGTTKVREIVATERTIRGIDVLEVVMYMDWDEQGWDDDIPDRGLHRRACPGDPTDDGSDVFDPLGNSGPVPPKSGMARLLDHDDEPLTMPVPLNGDGAPVPDGVTDRWWIRYRHYPRRAFLGIDFLSPSVIEPT